MLPLNKSDRIQPLSRTRAHARALSLLSSTLIWLCNQIENEGTLLHYTLQPNKNGTVLFCLLKAEYNGSILKNWNGAAHSSWLFNQTIRDKSSYLMVTKRSKGYSLMYSFWPAVWTWYFLELGPIYEVKNEAPWLRTDRSMRMRQLGNVS